MVAPLALIAFGHSSTKGIDHVRTVTEVAEAPTQPSYCCCINQHGTGEHLPSQFRNQRPKALQQNKRIMQH